VAETTEEEKEKRRGVLTSKARPVQVPGPSRRALPRVGAKEKILGAVLCRNVNIQGVRGGGYKKEKTLRQKDPVISDRRTHAAAKRRIP